MCIRDRANDVLLRAIRSAFIQYLKDEHERDGNNKCTPNDKKKTTHKNVRAATHKVKDDHSAWLAFCFTRLNKFMYVVTSQNVP